MYIFADIKWNCRKSSFVLKQRRRLKTFKTENHIFNFKDFIFDKYNCEMYILILM